MSENGDGHHCFSQAAVHHLDRLYRFAIVLTRDRTEAQDLVQETCLRAVRACARLLSDSNLKGWLFTIMRNIWLNELRHRRNGPVFVQLNGQHYRTTDDSGLGADPYFTHVNNIEREEMLRAIERLPRAHREVIVLHHIEGLSYQEISEILGCPAGTVMSRLGRAREKLRDFLPDGKVTAVKLDREG